MTLQIPSAALTKEQLAEYLEEGEETPDYLDADVELAMSTYYKPGTTFCIGSML